MGLPAEVLNQRFYDWLNAHFTQANLTLKKDRQVTPRFDGQYTTMSLQGLRYYFSFSDQNSNALLHMRTPSRIDLEKLFSEILVEKINHSLSRLNREQREIYDSFFGDDLRCYFTQAMELPNVLDVNLSVSFKQSEKKDVNLERDGFSSILGHFFSPVHFAILERIKSLNPT